MGRWLAGSGPVVWLWLRLLAAGLAVAASVYLLAWWLLPGALAWVAANIRLPVGQVVIRDVLESVEQAGPLGFAVASFGWAVWAGRMAAGRKQRRGTAAYEIENWIVQRPRELDEVVSALLRRDGATVGVTTALQGAGGFGKTVLAQMTRADRRVRRRFDGRVVWLTVGRDVRGEAAIVEKIHEVIRQVAPDAATRDAALGRAASVDAAGRELGALLEAGRGWLLVLDDVWFVEQLQPFLQGGRRCTRLVTTRNRLLMHGRGEQIQVDQMSEDQARQVLLFGLPPMSEWAVTGLLDVTGRWPLLLRLVNKILMEAHGAGRDLSGYGMQLYDRLRAGGPIAVDEIAGVDPAVLAVDAPAQRARAVEATMRASIGLLTPDERRLLLQLSVFSADEVVPLSLVARLWQVTEGIDELRVPRVCARLDELALISLDPADGGRVSMHEVVREYLRDLSRKDDGEALVRLNGLLLDDVAATDGRWWELGDGETYLWDNVIGHLIVAGRGAEAERVATDIRWAAARLRRFGSAAPLADLARVGTPRTERMRRALARTAHLLGPTSPPESITDVLRSRLADDPDWGAGVRDTERDTARPRLVNRWPLPDLPDLALLHILIGHTSAVLAVAISPDGAWMATGGRDRTVRLWDVAAGRQRAVLHGHTGPVHVIAISPDGSWMASAGGDRTIRLWDVATGRQRSALQGHDEPISALAIAPDGAQLATVAQDRTVRVWSAVTGQQQSILRAPSCWMRAVGTGEDGAWLAISSEDSSVRIHEPTTGSQRVMLQGYGNWTRSVTTDPQGSWLAAAGEDSRVRVWDVLGGRQRAVLQGLAGRVSAVALGPGADWLATGNHRGTIRIWDARTGHERAILRGHTASVSSAVVSADGLWLATAAKDRSVRVWDVAGQRLRAVVQGPAEGVPALAISRDGGWLVTAGDDAKVRIWDTAAIERPGGPSDHTGPVGALAADPGGAWLAAAGADGRIRLWDGATRGLIATLQGHTAPITALAVSPDGATLASAGEDGAIRLWDSATHRRLAVLQGHGSVVSVLAAVGSRFAGAGRDGSVRLWDGPVLSRPVLSRPGRAPLALVAAADWLAAVGADGRVRVWRMAPAGRSPIFDGRVGPVTAAAADPAGAWLVTAGDGQIRMWDPATGEPGRSWPGGADGVTAMSVSPDGRLLAACAGDTLRVWDVSGGRPDAMMRVDGRVSACAWLGVSGLAAGGAAGIYAFTYVG